MAALACQAQPSCPYKSLSCQNLRHSHSQLLSTSVTFVSYFQNFKFRKIMVHMFGDMTNASLISEKKLPQYIEGRTHRFLQNVLPGGATWVLPTLNSLISEQGRLLIRITLKRAFSFIREFRVGASQVLLLGSVTSFTDYGHPMKA